LARTEIQYPLLTLCPFTYQSRRIHPHYSTVVHELGNMKRRRASAARVSSAIKSALAGVSERPKDCAGVLVHDLANVHGDGEQENQKEKVDAKE
jgi:hypothetical protein